VLFSVSVLASLIPAGRQVAITSKEKFVMPTEHENGITLSLSANTHEEKIHRESYSKII
jgi:hypothetical protein